MSVSRLVSSYKFWLYIGCHRMDFPVIPYSDTTDGPYELLAWFDVSQLLQCGCVRPDVAGSTKSILMFLCVK